MRGKSSLINLILFYDKVTHLVDQGKPADIIFWDFSEIFNTVSHSIFWTNVQHTARQKHNVIGVQLADVSGSKACS